MSNALEHDLSVITTPSRGHLQLDGLLGAGGSGTVYRGELQMDDGRRAVAVKVPNRGCDLRREAAAMTRFAHPNIAGLVSAPERSTDPLIVELCDRGTLEDLLIERSLPLREVTEVVLAIGAALSTLHSSGWVHGDVNPSNIGLRSKDRPCLFDFGCARPADGSYPTSGTSQFCGESIRFVPELDVRSLAASAHAALASSHESLKNDLDRFIAAADDGESVSISELLELFEHSTQSKTLTRNSTVDDSPSPGGPADPPRPRTREFGPRPEPVEPDTLTPTSTSRDDDPLHRRKVGLALLAAVLLVVFASTSGSSDPQALEPEALLERVAATDTLQSADATWSDDGVISLELDGDRRTLAAGRAGDLAAIADWDCDGEATLGVYRPSTGAWFTFDSWSADTTSSVERLFASDIDGTELAVQFDWSGCARPVIGQVDQ